MTLPMGEAWRIGLGASWQVSEKINLNAGYEFLWRWPLRWNRARTSVCVGASRANTPTPGVHSSPGI
jgi:hypothetical protein